MKKNIAMVVAVCAVLAAVQASSPAVSLSGTVTGSGTSGISNARVSLKHYPQFFSFTDASGAYQLTSSAVLPRAGFASLSSTPHIMNGRLFFSVLSPSQKVTIEAFSTNGARVSCTRPLGLKSGGNSVVLSTAAEGTPGLRFIRLTIGNESHILKILSGIGSGTHVSGRGRASSFGQPNLTLGKTRAGFVDTLVITAQGYKNALTGITAYDQKSIQTALSASNQWKPSGALTRDKGMVKIMAKGYDFEMGQPDPAIGGDSAEPDLILSEQPVHTVSFTYDFWMDTTEVTQKEYDSTMKSAYADFAAPMNWTALYGKGDRYPTYYIYWGNAALYCNARSKKEGFDTVYSYTGINAPTGELCELFNGSADLSKNGYRLPTEAEWEYACRGGTATDFYWGKNYRPYPASAADIAQVNEYAVWGPVSWDLGEGAAGFGIHPVGTTKPNAYGLYDMAGNVSEHCHEYASVAYDYGTVVDPAGPATGDLGFMSRGGNWGNSAVKLRSANRNVFTANYAMFFLGFRSVRPAR